MENTKLVFLFGLAVITVVAGAKVNCKVSVWGGWVPVGAGLEERRRIIIWDPQDGGTPCPTDLVETRNTGQITYQTPKQAAKGIVNNILLGPQKSRTKRDDDAELPRDFIVVLDSSGSIGYDTFESVKPAVFEILIRLCGGIGTDSFNNKVSVISFSDLPRLDIPFTLYQDDPDMLLQKMLSVPYMGSSTCTGTAITETIDVFKKDSRPENEAHKEVLFITDGQSNCGTGVLQAMAQLRESYPNVKTYALLIGTYGASTTASDEALALTSSPLKDNLFHLKDFNDFFETMEFIKCYDSKIVKNRCVPYTLPGPIDSYVQFCPYTGSP